MAKNCDLTTATDFTVSILASAKPCIETAFIALLGSDQSKENNKENSRFITINYLSNI
jgi:hypothetical protein